MKKNKNYSKSKIIYQAFYIILFLVVMFAGCSKEKNENQHSIANKEYWTCPMHPEVKSDKPGICPICQMDLVKKISDENSKTDESDIEGKMVLNGKKQVLANVSTFKVSYENLTKEFSAYSYIDFAEQNRKVISAKFNGRIEKLFVNKSGDFIKQGEQVFEIYSPDLVQAQKEFLIALNNSSSTFIEAARKKLEIFGFTAKQIKELETLKEAKLIVPYFSPISGTVIEKKIQEGAYINEGSPLYDVADLTTVWNIAEFNENNLSNIKIGNQVRLKLKSYPMEVFKGRITFIYPVINSQTRTVKVRSEFLNNNLKLKPQMFGETFFSVNAGKGLLVPSDAILFKGKETIVWIKVNDGLFEAREVIVGEKFYDKYQILSGLNEGDVAAASGGFLIDSESQLKSGKTTAHKHDDESNKILNKNNVQTNEHKNHK